MRLNTKWRALFMVSAFLLLFIAGCQGKGGSDQAAPDFSLSDLSGNVTTLSELRGKVVLLDFWAIWCPPCRMSLPFLVRLQEKYGEKGFVILGVSLDDPNRTTNEYMLKFKEKFKINYKILRADKQILENYFGTSTPAIPTHFIIDRKGRIRNKIEGYEPGELEKHIEEVLG